MKRQGLEKIVQKSKDLGRNTLDAISKPVEPEVGFSLAVGCISPIFIYKITNNIPLSVVGAITMSIVTYIPTHFIVDSLRKYIDNDILLEDNNY